MKAQPRVQRCLLLILWLVAETPASAQLDKQSSDATASYEPYGRTSHDAWPAWSPDDKQILFTRFTPPDHGGLYLVPSSGGTAQAFSIESKYLEGQPAWSPDGRRVVFVSNRGGPFQIWTANASGGDLKRVTSSFAHHAEPCWSPDGKQLAYSSFPGPHIMVISVSGGEPEIFATGSSPAWSRDGKQIAYFSPTESSPETVSIAVKPISGGGTRRLTCSSTVQGTGWRPSMDWSPDGHRLVTMKLINGTWGLAIVNVDRDQLESTIPVSGSALCPRWSHDGQWVLFSSMDTGHPSVLRVVTPQGKLKTDLTEPRHYSVAQSIRYRSGAGLEIPSYLYLPQDSGLGKHAAVVWLHGGFPGATLNEFNPEIQYFVAQGFVVLAPNYRSSAGFGETLAKLKPGDDIVQDIVAAVDYLKGLKTVDPARLGILGQSFGGYLTLLSIATKPDLFAGAVDIYGPANLTTLYNSPIYRGMLVKLLGGTPEERPGDYRAASPATMAEQIKTPLLILHGDADREAPYQQSVEMAEALDQAHKEYRFITYKHAGHGFVGSDEIDAMQQSLRFLSTCLKAKP